MKKKNKSQNTFLFAEKGKCVWKFLLNFYLKSVKDTMKVFFLTSYVVLDFVRFWVRCSFNWRFQWMFFTSIKEINSLRKEVNSLLCKGINRLRKEINRLLSEGINRLRNKINGLLIKRMSNIYNIIEFYNFLLQFKGQRSASKPVCGFFIF